MSFFVIFFAENALRKSMCYVVDFKCFLKWAANESGFFRFLENVGHQRKDSPYFLECILCVTYINSVTHRELYFVG